MSHLPNVISGLGPGQESITWPLMSNSIPSSLTTLSMPWYTIRPVGFRFCYSVLSSIPHDPLTLASIREVVEEYGPFEEALRLQDVQNLLSYVRHIRGTREDEPGWRDIWDQVSISLFEVLTWIWSCTEWPVGYCILMTQNCGYVFWCTRTKLMF